jgi:GWxTD domain-containing protein
MKIIRLSAMALFVLGTAASSFAALSKTYADFAKGPYQYLLTNDERKQWSAISTDAAAEQFINLFWARRDPTPGTPANEFRDAVNQRVEVADGRFGQGRTKGSLTDRGKVFIAMGSPTKLRRASSEPTGTIQTPGSGVGPGGEPPTTNQGYSPKEIWEFEQARSPLKLGQAMVEIAFIDQYGSNDWKIDRVPRTDPARIFENVATSYVTQPGLTEVPTFSTAAATPAPVAAAPVVAAPAAVVNALTTEALRTAVTEARSAAKESDVLFLSTGEFITPDGDHFVPVQLWAPKSAGLAAGTEVTFFGAVENEAGTQVTSFEEPVTLVASNDDVYYARSLDLEPGKYRATFGFAREGKPVSVVSKPLVVTGLEKEAPGVSNLMLSTHIYPLTEAQNPTDPFSFGGLRVVPRGNSTFRKADELWYFVELRNPGKDATTSQPKLSMAVSVTGKSADGRNVKMHGPAQEVPAQELKGVPGHYGVGQAMPLATFRPGEYKLTMKLTDLVTNKTWELSEPFRVLE